MSSSTLHITNGNKTTDYLKSLGYTGDFITWREMLCEGKTSIDVGSETFWKTRFEFLKSSKISFSISSNLRAFDSSIFVTLKT